MQITARQLFGSAWHFGAIAILLVLSIIPGAAIAQQASISVSGGGTLAYNESTGSVSCPYFDLVVTGSNYTYSNFIYSYQQQTFPLSGSVTFPTSCPVGYPGNNKPSSLAFSLPSGFSGGGCTIQFVTDGASANNNSATLKCPNPGIQGYINPKYVILGVTYAPPGGNSSSFVSYANSSTLGNTSQTSSSFGDQFTETVALEYGGDIFGVIQGKVTATSSSGWIQSASTTNQVQISKTTTLTVKTPGVPNIYLPINRDYDEIELCLNCVALYTYYSGTGEIDFGGYAFDAADPVGDLDVVDVLVGQLNGDFGGLPPGIADAFSRSWVTTQQFAPGDGPGITPADYPAILAADPFSENPYEMAGGYQLTIAPGLSPATSTDGRFVLAASQSIPYLQAGPNSSAGQSETYSEQYMSTKTNTVAATYSYSESFGVETNLSASFFAGFSADFKTQNQMTWTTGSSESSTTGSSQTATVQVTSPPCPAAAYPCNPTYTEPHTFTAFVDTIWNSLYLQPNPFFEISSVAPSLLSIEPGSTGILNAQTAAIAGYSGHALTLTISGLPAGITYTQSGSVPGTNIQLAITVGANAAQGTYPVTIEGSDGSQSYFAYGSIAIVPVVASSSSSSSSSGGEAASSSSGSGSGSASSSSSSGGEQNGSSGSSGGGSHAGGGGGAWSPWSLFVIGLFAFSRRHTK